MSFFVVFLLMMCKLAVAYIELQGCVMCCASWVTECGNAEWESLSQGWPQGHLALLGRAKCGVAGRCRPAEIVNCCHRKHSWTGEKEAQALFWLCYLKV